MDSRREALRRAVVSMMFPGGSEPSFYAPPTKATIEALAQPHKETGYREEQTSLAFPEVRLILPAKSESSIQPPEPRAMALCKRESESDSSQSDQGAEKGLTKNQKRKLRKKKQKRAKVATQGNTKVTQAVREFCHVNPPDAKQVPVTSKELGGMVSDLRAGETRPSGIPCKFERKRSDPSEEGFVEFFQSILSLFATKDDESSRMVSQVNDGIQFLIDCQTSGSLSDELAGGLNAIKQFMENREHQLAEEHYFKLYIGQTSSKGGSHDPLQNQSTHKMLQSIKRLITFWKTHTTQQSTSSS